MSDQQGFPEPLGGGADDPGKPPKGTRGRTVAIVILAIVVALLLGLVAWLAFANGGSPTSTPTTTAPSTPSANNTSSSPSPTPTAGGIPRCTTDDLSVTLGTFEGTAGSSYVPIRFTNTSSTACELHGFPGVSFVGKGNGTQLGAPADWDQSQPVVQNTLQPGSVVVSNLRVAQAGNYDSSQCQPLTADGLRVYPPHSTQAVFVKAANLTACQNPAIHLLTVVSPVGPQK